LTVILEFGDLFWVERIIVPQTSVGAVSVVNVEVTFERTGLLLAYSSQIRSSHASSVFISSSQVQITETGTNTIPTMDANQSGFRAKLSNDHASSGVSIGAVITVMLKRPAR